MTSRFARHIATGVVALALVIPATPAQGQSGLESVIKQYSATSIEGYIQPLADVLVANLSLGYVSSSAPKKTFGFSLEAVAMTAALDESLRLYEAATPAGFQPANFTTPTIFGGTATAVNHQSLSGLSYRGSDGLVDAEYFPTAAPQVRLSGIMGTDIVFRYASSAMVPMLKEEDFPDLTLMGIGLQHSLNNYFKGLPVELSVGGSYNSLKFGDLVDLSAMSFGIDAGKTFGILGVSAGIASEGGSMTLTYTSTDPVSPGAVNIDLDVSRSIRFRLGGAINLGFIRFFGDAAFGNVASYAGGIRLGF